MKIFHVLTHFMPAQTAGTEMYVYALQHQLQKLGHYGGVIIPAFENPSPIYYEFYGIDVHGYPQHLEQNGAVQKGFIAPAGLSAFEKLLEKLNPDILHFHELSGSNGITLYHLQVARRKKIPVVFTMHLAGYICATGTLLKNQQMHCNGVIDIHNCTICTYRHQHLPAIIANVASNVSGIINHFGIRMYNRNGKIAGLLGRREMIMKHEKRLQEISNYCDNVVVLNNWFANMLLQNHIPITKLKVIEQALPFSLKKGSQPLRINYQNNQGIKLVFVGRIYPAKGLHLLLKALSDCNPNTFSLDIYGPCNDEMYLKKCQKIIKSGNAIRFCGIIEAGKTVDYLQNYDLLCLPSVVTEMAPLVIQEAFAAGLPVLASDVAGNAAFVEHKVNGLLFRFNDVSSLKEQLMRLVNEKGLYLRLKEQIKPPRTFEKAAEEYLKLYKNVLHV